MYVEERPLLTLKPHRSFKKICDNVTEILRIPGYTEVEIKEEGE